MKSFYLLAFRFASHTCSFPPPLQASCFERQLPFKTRERRTGNFFCSAHAQDGAGLESLPHSPASARILQEQGILPHRVRFLM